MNNQPYPLSKEQKLHQEILYKEQKYNNLLNSLSLIIEDLNNKDINTKEISNEIKSMIKYKRNYNGKIQIEEWLDNNNYSQGYNRYSKNGESFPKSEIDNLFYTKIQKQINKHRK